MAALALDTRDFAPRAARALAGLGEGESALAGALDGVRALVRDTVAALRP